MICSEMIHSELEQENTLEMGDKEQTKPLVGPQYESGRISLCYFCHQSL